uniref:Uncharacterized protein n=1 Tax=Rhizophora mucronata TaxID=61149 RepID=A0A2P2R2M2_RHIMU
MIIAKQFEDSYNSKRVSVMN